LWPAAVRGEELAVAPSTTPSSTSANAWPTRPFQALPRPIRVSIGLRVFRNVPSDVGVRDDHVVPYRATNRAAVLMIETDSISVIGPNLRVTAMNLADCPSQPVGRFWNCDQMDMIRHEAIRQDLDLVYAAPFSHQFQVVLIIVIAKERWLSTDSPLSDVMRKTRCDDTG
jgi:hypothetical protein